MMALAIDADPEAFAARRRLSDWLGSRSELPVGFIKRALSLPNEFVWGAMWGFDFIPDSARYARELPSDAHDDFRHGFALGRACLRRVRPDLFEQEKGAVS